VSGRVYLVGAGPGDPELLTLKAVKALACADVVLVDDLVGDGVLDHARPGARIVHVGKRGGCRSTPQEFIERLMVAEARAGRVVVRLKGGDPFVFGRGGEECAALSAAGVEFEVVSGITAGLAAAASLRIPLTHRDVGPGAIFVTGHGHGDRGPDWRALVATGLPLVIYMGVARCDEIQRALLAAGMPVATPAAVVSNASRDDERTLATRLDRLSEDLLAAGLASPAILVIGEVARSAAGTRAAPAPQPQRLRR